MHQLLGRARALLSRVSDTLARLDLPLKEARLAELEERSTDAAFWNDAEAARGVMREIASLRARADTWRGVERHAAEQVELLELAVAEDDGSLAADAAG